MGIGSPGSGEKSKYNFLSELPFPIPAKLCENPKPKRRSTRILLRHRSTINRRITAKVSSSTSRTTSSSASSFGTSSTRFPSQENEKSSETTDTTTIYRRSPNCLTSTKSWMRGNLQHRQMKNQKNQHLESLNI
jgi:hypothetical protein